MNTDQPIIYTNKDVKEHNNTRTINQIDNNPQPKTNEELKQEEKTIGIVSATAFVSQTIQTNIDPIIDLNVKKLNFLQTLGSFDKVKILCSSQRCGAGCRTVRSYQVLGIKDQNQENLIMTASQEELNCDSYGYMLVYRTNNIIFGTLGYQINPPSCLAGCCNGCCSGGCCTGCCDGCCKDCCCSCKGGCCSECCTCCQGCCQGGGCCLGGCCLKQGCLCCCDDGCCKGGFCTCCNCCCFEGGCCREPCCDNGCCPCPDFENILLDVRFLNTIQEALDIPSGLYVSTLYNPFDCCGCIPQNIAYKKCGEKFALDNKLCAFGNLELGILNLENKTSVGNAIQYKSFCSDVQSYDLDFPKDALPLEKLLIISEIFMFVFLKWDGFLNRNDMIITKKRKTLPGLNPDFI